MSRPAPDSFFDSPLEFGALTPSVLRSIPACSLRDGTPFFAMRKGRGKVYLSQSGVKAGTGISSLNQMKAGDLRAIDPVETSFPSRRFGFRVGYCVSRDAAECIDDLLCGESANRRDYEIALTAYENMSIAENYGSGTLADGFTGLDGLATGESLAYAFDVDLTATGGGTTPPPPPPPVTPVPEPGTAALVETAMAGLQWVRVRRRRG